MQIPFEVIGYIGGKAAKNTLVSRWIVRKAAKFNTSIFGLENLDKIKDSFVIASNHLTTKNGGLLKSGISSDSFIIYKVVQKHLRKEIALAANYLLDKPFSSFEIPLRGFVKGLGYIPVGKGKESFHNVFLREVEKVIFQKRPILIYPVGAQREDFTKDQELKAGAAYISLKYGIPVIPAYIKGGNDWDNTNQKVFLFFGPPVFPKNLSIDMINQRIKETILQLRNKYLNTLSL